MISTLKPQESDFLTRACYEIERSEIDRDLPVLYPGSGGDVTHAVLLGKNLVFVDPHQPEIITSEVHTEIKNLGGEILEEKRKGKLSKGGKYSVTFSLEGEEINLTYCAQDATKLKELGLKELEKGYSVYFVKVPLPKEISAGSLKSPQSLGPALENLKVGGFYLERECPLPDDLISEMGFKKIATGHVSGLSIHPEEGKLYYKVEQVENLGKLLEEYLETKSQMS